MTMPNNEILKKTLQWINYADDDIRYARHGMTMSDNPPYRLIAYHSQQSIEKYLKAFLVFSGIDFPYTHNISLLLDLCADIGGWTEDLRDAEELSVYAVSVRYPGEDENVTMDEATRSIDIAAKVRFVVRDIFVSNGIVLPDD